MPEWPWKHRSRSKVIIRDTPSHDSDHLCLIWKESIQNCRYYRADTACGTDIFQMFYCQVMLELPRRYRSRSKVIVHDTTSHGGDHLCLIWKECIQNCRCYRADTACGTDGQTDGRSETNIPLTTLLCEGVGGVIKLISCYQNLTRWVNYTSEAKPSNYQLYPVNIWYPSFNWSIYFLFPGNQPTHSWQLA